MGYRGNSQRQRVDGRGMRPALPYAIAERPAPPGVVVLALSGEFDLAVVPVARERLEQARAQRPRAIVLVMSEVTFADSCALRELLRLDAAMGADEALLVLAELSPAVERLLDVTRARDLLAVAPTVGDALDRAMRWRRLRRPAGGP